MFQNSFKSYFRLSESGLIYTSNKTARLAGTYHRFESITWRLRDCMSGAIHRRQRFSIIGPRPKACFLRSQIMLCSVFFSFNGFSPTKQNLNKSLNPPCRLGGLNHLRSQAWAVIHRNEIRSILLLRSSFTAVPQTWPPPRIHLQQNTRIRPRPLLLQRLRQVPTSRTRPPHPLS